VSGTIAQFNTAVTDADFATLAGSETLTNKTLTSPVINVGSDAQGDIYYRNGSGAFTRLAPGTSGHYLKTNGAGANPAWAAIGGGGDLLAANNLSDVASAATAFSNIKQAATDTATGVIELATNAEVATGTDTTRAVTPAGLRAGVFPSGTRIIFQQTSAPTGWTKDTTHNDVALRLVNGAVGSGGTDQFTGVFGASVGGTTLTNAHLPASISATGGTFAAQSGSDAVVLRSGTASTGTLVNTGGGTSHTHSIPSLQYVDVIIGVKD
jgi:hypothetical protein